VVDLAPPYVATAAAAAESPRSLRAGIIGFCRRQPLGTVGLVVVMVMAAAGLSAEWIAPYSPTSNNFAAMTEAPSWAHLWAPTSSAATCSPASSSARAPP